MKGVCAFILLAVPALVYGKFVCVYCIVLYCIDRRIDLNLSKSTQSAAGGVKAVKPVKFSVCSAHAENPSIETRILDLLTLNKKYE